MAQVKIIIYFLLFYYTACLTPHITPSILKSQNVSLDLPPNFNTKLETVIIKTIYFVPEVGFLI